MAKCDDCGSTNVDIHMMGFIRAYVCNVCGNTWSEIYDGTDEEEDDDDDD